MRKNPEKEKLLDIIYAIDQCGLIFMSLTKTQIKKYMKNMDYPLFKDEKKLTAKEIVVKRINSAIEEGIDRA